jgi:hypothetical protein
MTGQFLGRVNSPPGAYVADQTMINSSASPVELMTFCDYLLPSTNQPRWEVFVFNTTLDKSSGRFAIAPNTTAGCLEMGPPKPASNSVAPASAGSVSAVLQIHACWRFAHPRDLLANRLASLLSVRPQPSPSRARLYSLPPVSHSEGYAESSRDGDEPSRHMDGQCFRQTRISNSSQSSRALPISDSCVVSAALPGSPR